MWVAFLMLQGVFRPSNSDQLYGEVCVNRIYGEIQKHSTKALTAKSVLFANQKIFPQLYTVLFDIDRNQVVLWFENGVSNWVLSVLTLSGGGAQPYCMTSSYRIVLTGMNSTLLRLSKNNQSTLTQPSRSLDGLLTGSLELLLCPRGSWSCKDFYKIAIDTRVQRLSLISCAQRSSPEHCSIWRE